MSLGIRLLESGCRAIVGLAPEHVREQWGEDLQATFRAACLEAERRHGVIGLARNGGLELFDLIRASVRARFAQPLPITGGHPPRHPKQKGQSLMQTLAKDFRLALRSLRASPAHATIGILTLALGIGISVGIFSVLDALLIRPAPFVEADRLTELWNLAEESKVQFPGFSRTLIGEWTAQTDLFDRVEAFDDDVAVFQGERGAEATDMAVVTPGMFAMLGVAPSQGRYFVDGDGRDGSDLSVVISERLWRSMFGSRPDIVGHTLQINNRPHTVIGVMPATFHFPYRTTELWTPLDPASPPAAKAATPFTMLALARVAPAVSMDAVMTQVTERGARLRLASGGDAGISAVARPRNRRDSDATARTLQVLGGAVMFLLLIVCANIANLSLARALARGRDFAVRSALGATRRDLIRETVVEHLVVGLTGAALGVAVAWIVVSIANASLPLAMTSSSLNAIDLDARALGMALAAGLLTSLLFGLPPAWLGSRPNLLGIIGQQSRSSIGSKAARRWRGGLVVAEVMLAMVLLLGAALMGRSLLALEALDRGFDTTGLVTVRVGMPVGRYTDPRARDQFSEEMIARLRGLPEVQSVTAGDVPPTPSGSTFGALEFAHQPGQPSEQMSAPFYRVWPDYFDRIGLRLVEGRSFAANEPSSSVIVSESFARKYWPGTSAVGGQFRFTGATVWRTVVGVSTEVRQMDLDDVYGAFEWFVPLQTPPGATPARRAGSAVIAEHRTFVVRASNSALTLRAMQDVVHQVDPSVVIWKAATVDESFGNAVARPRVLLRVLLVFAVLGLVLAAAGLYGVLSYLVTQRMREIGVRLALGATPGSVFGLVLRHGAILTVAGLLLGGIAASLLVRTMRSLLFEVQPSDPVAMGGVAALLLTTALFACWRPARRAMKVDPVSLLREQ